MKTKITKLKLENFRNIPELEITFNDGFNEIAGENGVGKTTILTAITFALFGKDIFNKKQFSILPIVDGVEQKDMTSVVELTIDNSFVVSRSWDGKTTEVKTGFIEENGKINLVKCTQTDFKKFLEEHFVDEDEFKSLSNINYLPSLHWKELKEFIFKLIGEITDEDVLLNGTFPLNEEFIKKMGSKKLSESLAASKSVVNEEIKKCEVEANYALQMKLKYVNDGRTNDAMMQRKEELETKISDWHKLKEVEDNKRQKIMDLQTEINSTNKNLEFSKIAVKTHLDNIESLKEVYKANSFNVENMRQQEIADKKKQRLDVVYKLNAYESEISVTEKKIIEIKEKGNTLKQKEIKIENSKCSACGQELPEEIQSKTLEKLKQQQLIELQNLMSLLNESKDKLEKLNSNKVETENEIKAIDLDIETISTKEYQEVEETEQQKQIKLKMSEVQIKLQEAETNVSTYSKNLEKLDIELSNAEQPKELEPIYVVQAELKEINEKLATSVTLQALENEIENKNKALENAKLEKQTLFEKEQELIKFNDLKAELLKSKIRQHFDYVEFITKEETKQGDLVETFELSHNGIKYNELNSAMKIIVSMDLINGVQKLKNKRIPILIDNCESVTNLPAVDTQVIAARVLKQPIKKLLVNGN